MEDIENEIPTAVEFLQNFTEEPNYDSIYKAMIEFTKLHVKAALKNALQESLIRGDILNCYPEENIK